MRRAPVPEVRKPWPERARRGDRRSAVVRPGWRRLLAGAAIILGLVGCGPDTSHEIDAPEPAVIDDAPAKVLAFPDGFGNVAFKCNGTVGVYSPTHGQNARAIQVLKDDPNCPGR